MDETVGDSAEHERRVGRDDELDVGKRILKLCEGAALPGRMQVQVNLVDQHDTRRSQGIPDPADQFQAVPDQMAEQPDHAIAAVTQVCQRRHAAKFLGQQAVLALALHLHSRDAQPRTSSGATAEH